MKTHIALFLATLFVAASYTSASAADSLTLVGRTELPGYTGDFDHFEYDLKGNRLWLAAEDHETLEVFDLKTMRLQKSLRGIVDTPHGVYFVPGSHRLIVSDTGGGSQVTRLIDSNSYKAVGTLKLAAPGGDAMGYDASTNRLYIVNGGRDAKMKETYLSAIDPLTLKHYGDLKFDTDKVEAMAIEQKGNKLYINVTGKNLLAVVDKNDLKVLNTWPIKEAEQNAPIAFDESTKRLFVITRKPGKLLVINADTGATVANFVAPGRCDQVIWDPVTKRIYAIGGEGYIGVFQQKGGDLYEEMPHIVSATGAKTGILIPELKRLYVAVSPGEAKTGAAILRYDIGSAAP
jgi:DNA-binding beta-propeller fold protein YncE